MSNSQQQADGPPRDTYRKNPENNGVIRSVKLPFLCTTNHMLFSGVSDLMFKVMPAFCSSTRFQPVDTAHNTLYFAFST